MTPLLDARERLLRELAEEVGDRRVLKALASVPRQLFVPPDLREHAWLNLPLPIDEGQTISQPLVVAHMCELLRLTDTDRVLDVGTGTGYHAALLSRLAGHVHSIERHEPLSRQAADNLRQAGIDNVTLVVGDGTLGYADAGPYDAINVAAASPDGVPPALEDQLALGGRMIIPTGRTDRQTLVLVERVSTGEVRRTRLRGVRFVPLVAGRGSEAGPGRRG
ncbi:MAG TPA: protein-L-isoaspartate(D-aspartate) O-methyltransferase [Solirubrobacteraceae bacterium]|jgi:protein-L-isoaspartate(D-aspartate) O-methyltransferase|nr:protein-L-isoaspartate(D-aspartate) O-methyltransferase [Solirubrobacteraceae bacterium]